MPETSSLPAVPSAVLTPITPGRQTSEYQVAQQGNLFSLLGLLLSGLLAVLPTVLSTATPDSKLYIWGGTALGIATVLHSTLTKAGYIKSRTDVKCSPWTGELKAD